MKIMVAAMAGLALVAWNAQANCGACAPGDKAKEAVKGEHAAHAEHGARTVDTAGLKKIVEAGAGTVILDARSGKWDDKNRIGGAKSLNAESSAAEIAAALPDKNAKIVTYCAGLTCPASGHLAKKLNELGYTDVTEYPEGIEGWVKAGNAVSKAAN